MFLLLKRTIQQQARVCIVEGLKHGEHLGAVTMLLNRQQNTQPLGSRSWHCNETTLTQTAQVKEWKEAVNARNKGRTLSFTHTNTPLCRGSNCGRRRANHSLHHQNDAPPNAASAVYLHVARGVCCRTPRATCGHGQHVQDTLGERGGVRNPNQHRKICSATNTHKHTHTHTHICSQPRGLMLALQKTDNTHTRTSVIGCACVCVCETHAQPRDVPCRCLLRSSNPVIGGDGCGWRGVAAGAQQGKGGSRRRTRNT